MSQSQVFYFILLFFLINALEHSPFSNTKVIGKQCLGSTYSLMTVKQKKDVLVKVLALGNRQNLSPSTFSEAVGSFKKMVNLSRRVMLLTVHSRGRVNVFTDEKLVLIRCLTCDKINKALCV